jgi:uncharacterized protein with HEPN domain
LSSTTRLEVRKYLYDIREAGRLILDFIEGKSFDDYGSDPLLRSAVERQFEIIGEALGNLLRLTPELSERISYSPRIIAFRNRLIHGYASVSNELVWGIVESHLPTLMAETQALLADGGPGTPPDILRRP